ncbi:MAG TPA: hypothetical protein VG204_20295 [Terriglobia bacterium]|nr:hypothetical protein [Terriglobia bacterium]
MRWTVGVVVLLESVRFAFSSSAAHFLARAGAPQTWEEFATANPDLLSWKDSILNKYYRAETLTSALAKSTFLFPDKL